MKGLRLIGVVLLLFILQLPLVRNAKSLPEIHLFKGDFAQVYSELKEEFGPWDAEIVLEDGASLKKGKVSFDILRDNYKGSDYLVFINK
ncbi:MAG TPA: hypothetical protein VFD08_02405 [Clostridia bacterium]|nr:hypothetical protein [Clostridia bacterium]